MKNHLKRSISLILAVFILLTNTVVAANIDTSYTMTTAEEDLIYYSDNDNFLEESNEITEENTNRVEQLSALETVTYHNYVEPVEFDDVATFETFEIPSDETLEENIDAADVIESNPYTDDVGAEINSEITPDEIKEFSIDNINEDNIASNDIVDDGTYENLAPIIGPLDISTLSMGTQKPGTQVIKGHNITINYHWQDTSNETNISYCLNSNRASPNTTYTKVDFKDLGFSSTKEKQMKNVIERAYVETNDFSGWDNKNSDTEGNYYRQSLQIALWWVTAGTSGNYPTSWMTNDAVFKANSVPKYFNAADNWFTKKNTAVKHTITVKKSGKTEKVDGFIVNKYNMTSTNISDVKLKSKLPSGGSATLKNNEIIVKIPESANSGTFTIDLEGKYVVPATAAYLASNTSCQNVVVTKPTNGTVTAQIEGSFEAEPASIIIYKEDKSNGDRLAGAEIGVYSNKECTQLLEKLTTGSDGSVTTKKYDQGTKLYFKELAAPSGYDLINKIYTKTIGVDTSITFKNSKIELTPASIRILKTGSTLGLSTDSIIETADGGVTFNYSHTSLSGAKFKIYADENIYKYEQQLDLNNLPILVPVLIFSKNQLVETVTCDEDGIAKSTVDLYEGNYRIEESQTPEFFIQSQPTYVQLTSSDDSKIVTIQKDVPIHNDVPDVEIKITKKDADDKTTVIHPTTFGLYAAEDIINEDDDIIVEEGRLIATSETVNGTASFKAKLPLYFSYSIKEINAPLNYVYSEEEYIFTPKYKDYMTPILKYTYEFENQPVRGYVHFYKLDIEKRDGSTPQGDATLEGAIYGLYARKNIVHPSGNGQVIIPAGTLVGKSTTDIDGYGEFTTTFDKNNIERNGLYLGDYYIKEIVPSKGYNLSTEEFEVSLYYENQYVEISDYTTYVTELVQKQGFKLIKVSDDGNETELPPLSAGFKIFLISDLSRVKNGEIKSDKNGNYSKDQFIDYNFSNETPAILYDKNPDGDIIDELWSSSTDGSLESPRLPFGQYIVVETSTPDERYTINPFIVKIVTESNIPQRWRVFLDKEFKANIKIIKKDSDTGKNILKAGAKFKIYDSNNELVVQHVTYPKPMTISEFETTDDGTLMLAEPLTSGTYLIVETHSPDDYIIGEPVKITITNKDAYLIDAEFNQNLIEIIYYNKPAVGELTIIKTGDKLTEYTQTESGENNENHIDGKEFIYSEQPIAGATFKIYAAKNIYKSDNHKDENGHGYKYYETGDLVNTINTDITGKAIAKNLPLGSYYIEETRPGSGFILNKERKYFDIVYQGETVEIVYAEENYFNLRQNTSAGIIKSDIEDSDKLIQGAVYGLYTKNKILNYETEVIVFEDELIRKAITDKNGFAHFGDDIPFGEYYVKELIPPIGYHKDENTYDLTLSYQGASVVTAINHVKVKDVPTKIFITKTDITTSNSLDGAKLCIIDKNGNIIDEWLSNSEKPHLISGLLGIGETYILRELIAPSGYLKAGDIEFTIEDAESQEIKMEDHLVKGRLIVTKTGEVLDSVSTFVKLKGYLEHIFHWISGSIANIEFDLYAAEDIKHPDGQSELFYKKDELVANLITNTSGIAEATDLPLGNYYLIERNANEGHTIISDPIYVSLQYQGQTIPVVTANYAINNNRQKVNITVIKQDEDTKSFISDAIFGLYNKNEINNYQGKNLVPANTLLHTSTTDKDGKAIFEEDIPLGHYYVKELKAPNGFALSDVVLEFDASYQGHEIEVIKLQKLFTNSQTKIEVIKTDITTGNLLPGVTLRIIDKNGLVCDQWLSSTESHVIRGLLVDETYILQEISPTPGYTTAKDISFSIKNKKELQTIEMKDDVTKVEISKQDIATGKEIPGTEFKILDSNNNIVESWTSTNIPHYFEKLPVGTYTLVETPASGYVKGENLTFTIKDSGEIQKIVVKNDFTKVMISKQDITSSSELEGAELVIKNSKGDIVEKWISSDTPHYIERLPVGDYVLIENIAPDGYTIANDMHFKVIETGEIQSFTMKDDYTKLQISKKDITNEEEVEGAHLTLINADDNIIEEWISGSSPHYIEKLPAGEYRLREKLAPAGYLTAEEITFTISETNEIQTVTMYDDYTKVKIAKKDSKTKEYVIGAELVLLDSDGSIVEKWITENKAHLIERLPIGAYTLKESSAPDGYNLADNIIVEVIDKASVQEYVMYDSPFNETPDKPLEPEDLPNTETTNKPNKPSEVPTPDTTPDTENSTSTPSNDNKPISKPNNKPKTGDNTIIMPYILILILCLIIIIYSYKKIVKRSKK